MLGSKLFPTKLPPLQLTSRPIKVDEMWGEYNYKRKSAGVSLVVHALAIGGLIALSIAGAKVVNNSGTAGHACGS